ncbi:MAG: site-specific DNA-methyltransferase [Desulfobaccales bacterium]
MTNQATIIIADSRSMTEVADAAIDLVVTSPPYWHIKDYGVPGQIGYGQSLHDYLKDLYRTWRECFRVLREGARLCINIGDQFARAAVYGRYKVIPLHAEFINQCEAIGFDFLGAIIWQKKTTMNPSGGATVMGSYPFPPNGIVELDYEFIQIFKKPGPSKKVSKEVKAASRLTKEEWKEYFAGHWYFGGVKQVGHEAMFPEELPRRLIRMFTFQGDTVLDPFVGSGTTVKAALDLGRNAVGYEINEEFLAAVPRKLSTEAGPLFPRDLQIIRPNKRIEELPQIDYTPAIRNAEPRPEGHRPQLSPDRLHKVTRIIDERTIALDDGARVAFLGVRIDRKAETLDYLRTRILGKNVFIKDAQTSAADGRAGYIYLKNRIFINAHLIKSGLGSPDLTVTHKLQKKFIRLQEQRGEIQSNQT